MFTQSLSSQVGQEPEPQSTRDIYVKNISQINMLMSNYQSFAMVSKHLKASIEEVKLDYSLDTEFK